MNIVAPPARETAPCDVDLPIDAGDARERFRALPVGARLVYWRGDLIGRLLWPAGRGDTDEHERTIRAIADSVGAAIRKLHGDGKALLVQRRVGPVEDGVRDYIAVKIAEG